MNSAIFNYSISFKKSLRGLDLISLEKEKTNNIFL